MEMDSLSVVLLDWLRPFICCNKWLRFVQTTEEDPFPCLICNSHEKTCPTSHACPLVLFFSFPPLMNLQLESAVGYVKKNEWGMEKDLSFFHICSKYELPVKATLPLDLSQRDQTMQCPQIQNIIFPCFCHLNPLDNLTLWSQKLRKGCSNLIFFSLYIKCSDQFTHTSTNGEILLYEEINWIMVNVSHSCKEK